jgi:hypothetical protein
MATNPKRSAKRVEPAPALQEKSRPALLQDLLFESLRVSDQKIFGLATEVLVGVGAQAIPRLALAAQDPTKEAGHRKRMEDMLARLRSDQPLEPARKDAKPNSQRLMVVLMLDALRVEDEKMNGIAGDLMATMGEDMYRCLVAVALDPKNDRGHRARALIVSARIPAPEGWQPGQEFPTFTAALEATGWRPVPGKGLAR